MSNEAELSFLASIYLYMLPIKQFLRYHSTNSCIADDHAQVFVNRIFLNFEFKGMKSGLKVPSHIRVKKGAMP